MYGAMHVLHDTKMMTVKDAAPVFYATPLPQTKIKAVVIET